MPSVPFGGRHASATHGVLFPHECHLPPPRGWWHDMAHWQRLAGRDSSRKLRAFVSDNKSTDVVVLIGSTTELLDRPKEVLDERCWCKLATVKQA